MLLGLSNPGRAIAYTLIFLGCGFIWGAVSANIASIREARSIPFLANNWAVATPVFLIWTVLSFFLARHYLQMSGGGALEGLRLGVLFASAAILFDVVIVAGIVGQGWRHFAQPILWITYALLVLIPWLVGRGVR